jgi:hypothetical protein
MLFSLSRPLGFRWIRRFRTTYNGHMKSEISFTNWSNPNGFVANSHVLRIIFHGILYVFVVFLYLFQYSIFPQSMTAASTFFHSTVNRGHPSLWNTSSVSPELCFPLSIGIRVWFVAHSNWAENTFRLSRIEIYLDSIRSRDSFQWLLWQLLFPLIFDIRVRFKTRSNWKSDIFGLCRIEIDLYSIIRWSSFQSVFWRLFHLFVDIRLRLETHSKWIPGLLGLCRIKIAFHSLIS